MLTSDTVGDGFGAAIAGAELTGDAYDDVLIGAPTYTGDLTFEGRVLLFRGNMSGVESTPSWVQEGDITGAGFGGSIVAIPNGGSASCHAILVGSPDANLGRVREGAAWMFTATPSGYQLVWSAQGGEPYAYFGYALAAGDIDADGYTDLLVGGFGADSSRGKVSLFLGSANGPPASANATLTGANASDYFGVSLAFIRDMDGDNLSEVAIGAMGEDAGGRDAGSVHIYEWDGIDLSEGLVLDGLASGAFFGSAVHNAGRFAPGVRDGLLIGAPWYDGGSGWVGAYGTPGSSTVSARDALSASVRIVPNPASVATSRIMLGETIVSRIDWIDATGRVLASLEDHCGLTASIPLSRFHVDNPPRRSWIRLSGPWGSAGVPILLRS